MMSSVSTDLIETVYQCATEAGAIAGKVSGAGGGGFMVFICEPTRRLDVVRELRKLPRMVVNPHFTARDAVAWRTDARARA